MIFKKVIFFLVVIFFLFACTERKDTIDNDDKKIHALFNKASKVNNDSLPFYLQKIDKLISNFTADTLKADVCYLKAKSLFINRQKDSAFKYYDKTISYFNDSISRLKVHRYFLIISKKYTQEGNYLNSLGVLKKHENLIKKNDYVNLALSSDLVKTNYAYLLNFKKTAIYNKKAIKYYRLAGDRTSVINNLLYQAELNFYNLKNKNKAYYLLDSIGKISNWNNFYLKYYYYNNYGVFNSIDGNYELAYKDYLKALFYIKKSTYKDDLTNLGDCYANITEVLIKSGKYFLAKKYMDSTTIYAKYLNLNQTKFYLQNKLQLSVLTDQKIDNIINDVDSLFVFMNKTYEKRIDTELSILKEANEKEKKLLVENKNSKINYLKLKRKQLLLFTVLVLLLFALILSFSLYKQYKLKTAKNEMFMQQRLFRSQMNPHFTSNILYSIKRLITKDTKLANKYLIKFSRLLRLILENSMQDYISIEKELDVLTKYLDLQQLRFQKRFKYTILTDGIDVLLTHIPPMLIQPFVENVVEHAFYLIEYEGELEIRLVQKKNVLLCEIEDNGVGINSKKNRDNHQSTSTELIKDLLIKLTHKKINTINKKQGTLIQFEIPYKIK